MKSKQKKASKHGEMMLLHNALKTPHGRDLFLFFFLKWTGTKKHAG